MLIDDSIVRGTTSRSLVELLRDAGAAEVHLRITSPPYAFPSFYGTDTQARSELIAASMSVEQIRDHLGADSLEFLSEEGLIDAIGLNDTGPYRGLCTAYFDGAYPTALHDYEREYQASLDGPSQSEGDQ